MGLLTQERKAKRPKRAPARALAAAGLRMDGLSTDALRAISQTRQDWQAHAWGYRDAIGELRGGVQFLARAVSQVQFLPAEVNPRADEPIPIGSDEQTISPDLAQAAQEELDRLPLGSGYSFLGILVENLSIPGEVWLHGFYDEAGNECWLPRSTDEVDVSPDGRLTIKDGPGGLRREVRIAKGDLAVSQEDEEQESPEELLRLWVPHPRYRQLADSPMRALLDVCEEIVLTGMELRASSRSRVMANGILLVPSGLTMLNALVKDRSLANDNAFMAELQATLLAPIGNEGEAGAVVPAVIQGNAEDLDKIRHLKLERTTSNELLDRLERCLKRLGGGMDIPPEIVSGMADVNHWTAWQIDASTFKHHIDPMTRIVADALTEGFLRPALVDRGYSVADAKRVQVWRDAGNLTENPNRGADAVAAFDRGALGFEALLEALGFEASDAPSPEEFARIMALKTGVDATQAGLILAALLGDRLAPQPEVIDATPEQRALPPAESDTPAGGAPGNAPTQTTPEQNSLRTRKRGLELAAALVAAATPDPTAGWTVDEAASNELVALDRALRERLLHAADAALDRALEKAGSRARSKANSNAATRAFVVSAPADMTRMCAHLGRQQVYALGLREHQLLEGAFDALEGKFEKWTTATAEQVAKVVLRMLGLSGGGKLADSIQKRIVAKMTGRIGSAWQRLRTNLMGVAERYLFSPEPEEQPGEHPDTLVPPLLIRAALAEVGGLPVGSSGLDERGVPVDQSEPLGGIGNGVDVREALDAGGALELGYEWLYGFTPTPRQQFDPHRRLNGYRFADWDDPKLVPSSQYAWVGPYYTPGDHQGCQCDYRLLFAVPDRDTGSALEPRELADAADPDVDLGEETDYMRDIRRLAEGDDAAGRTGTTAQRERDTRDLLLALQKQHITNGGKN